MNIDVCVNTFTHYVYYILISYYYYLHVYIVFMHSMCVHHKWAIQYNEPISMYVLGSFN